MEWAQSASQVKGVAASGPEGMNEGGLTKSRERESRNEEKGRESGRIYCRYENNTDTEEPLASAHAVWIDCRTSWTSPVRWVSLFPLSSCGIGKIRNALDIFVMVSLVVESLPPWQERSRPLPAMAAILLSHRAQETAVCISVARKALKLPQMQEPRFPGTQPITSPMPLTRR